MFAIFQKIFYEHKFAEFWKKKYFGAIMTINCATFVKNILNHFAPKNSGEKYFWHNFHQKIMSPKYVYKSCAIIFWWKLCQKYFSPEYFGFKIFLTKVAQFIVIIAPKYFFSKFRKFHTKTYRKWRNFYNKNSGVFFQKPNPFDTLILGILGRKPRG